MSFARVIGDMINECYQGRAGSSRMQGGMIAKVVDNVDPEQRYRVRVGYPWLADQYTKGTTSDGGDAKVQSFWARIVTSMSGSEIGSFWLPEIDDEVMVNFEDGDFSRPIIIGSLWNGSTKSPRSLKYSPDHTEVKIPNKDQDGKNDFRFIRSRMGHQLAFIDKEGEGGVSLRSNKTAELYIDDKDGEEKVRLYDKDQQQWLEIDVPGKKITLQTDSGEILIKAKEKIRIECKNLEIDVEEKIKIDAGKAIDQDSDTWIVDTQGKMDITAGAKMTLKGSQIHLNS